MVVTFLLLWDRESKVRGEKDVSNVRELLEKDRCQAFMPQATEEPIVTKYFASIEKNIEGEPLAVLHFFSDHTGAVFFCEEWSRKRFEELKRQVARAALADVPEEDADEEDKEEIDMKLDEIGRLPSPDLCSQKTHLFPHQVRLAGRVLDHVFRLSGGNALSGLPFNGVVYRVVLPACEPLVSQTVARMQHAGLAFKRYSNAKHVVLVQTSGELEFLKQAEAKPDTLFITIVDGSLDWLKTKQNETEQTVTQCSLKNHILLCVSSNPHAKPLFKTVVQSDCDQVALLSGNPFSLKDEHGMRLGFHTESETFVGFSGPDPPENVAWTFRLKGSGEAASLEIVNVEGATCKMEPNVRVCTEFGHGVVALLRRNPATRKLEHLGTNCLSRARPMEWCEVENEEGAPEAIARRLPCSSKWSFSFVEDCDRIEYRSLNCYLRSKERPCFQVDQQFEELCAKLNMATIAANEAKQVEGEGRKGNRVNNEDVLFADYVFCLLLTGVEEMNVGAEVKVEKFKELVRKFMGTKDGNPFLPMMEQYCELEGLTASESSAAEWVKLVYGRKPTSTQEIVADLSTGMKIVRVKSRRKARALVKALLTARQLVGMEKTFAVLGDFGKADLRTIIAQQDTADGYWKKEVNVDLRGVFSYEALSTLPCLVVLASEGCTGVTFPASLDWLDLRVFHENTPDVDRAQLASFVQEAGRLCRHAKKGDPFPRALVSKAVENEMLKAHSVDELYEHGLSLQEGMKVESDRHVLLFGEPRLGKTGVWLSVLQSLLSLTQPITMRVPRIPEVQHSERPTPSLEELEKQGAPQPPPVPSKFGLYQRHFSYDEEVHSHFGKKMNPRQDHQRIVDVEEKTRDLCAEERKLMLQDFTHFLCGARCCGAWTVPSHVAPQTIQLQSEDETVEVKLFWPNEEMLKAATREKIWIFTPSHGRARQARLNYRHVMPNPFEYVHIVVIQADDLAEYQHYWGSTKCLMVLPDTMKQRGRSQLVRTAKTHGIGFARMVIQLFGECKNLNSLFMLDDNIQFFSVLKKEGRKVCKLQLYFKSLMEVMHDKQRQWPSRHIAVLGCRREGEFYNTAPFTREFVHSAFLLNVPRCRELKRFYSAWPYWEDNDFSCRCDPGNEAAPQSMVVSVNRFQYHSDHHFDWMTKYIRTMRVLDQNGGLVTTVNFRKAGSVFDFLSDVKAALLSAGLHSSKTEIVGKRAASTRAHVSLEDYFGVGDSEPHVVVNLRSETEIFLEHVENVKKDEGFQQLVKRLPVVLEGFLFFERSVKEGKAVPKGLTSPDVQPSSPPNDAKPQQPLVPNPKRRAAKRPFKMVDLTLPPRAKRTSRRPKRFGSITSMKSEEEEEEEEEEDGFSDSSDSFSSSPPKNLAKKRSKKTRGSDSAQKRKRVAKSIEILSRGDLVVNEDAKLVYLVGFKSQKRYRGLLYESEIIDSTNHTGPLFRVTKLDSPRKTFNNVSAERVWRDVKLHLDPDNEKHQGQGAIMFGMSTQFMDEMKDRAAEVAPNCRWVRASPTTKKRKRSRSARRFKAKVVKLDPLGEFVRE